MPATQRTGDLRAELFVRETLPHPAQQCRQRTIARLERLAADEVLAGSSVTSWAKRVPLEQSEPSLERDRYNEFASWASENGVRLTPFFDTRECYSMDTGEKRRELVMPALCLALYEDDELLTVVPHATDDGTESVRDCLAQLAEDTPEDRTERTILTAD